ncbi:MAG: DAK2 domain-containing protein [Clostridia bacterium]|nr:DAK2 domain-containing protein [Clostridia bacterium]
MQQFLDGVTLNYVFTVGYRNLKKNMTAINDLNVFPVPDGDTGTNMVHTFGGGLGAVTQTKSVSEYMQQLAHSVLLSARGNSGVIFSQFIYGFAQGVKGKETICFADLSEAFLCAKQEAYKSIISPTEGTILTVISEAAQFLSEKAHLFSDFKDGLEQLVLCMKDTLSRTPDMLPVLKQAGVVDSGGAGLVCFFEGVYAYFCGVSIEDIKTVEAELNSSDGVTRSQFGPDSVMEYGYCTEFILQLMNAKTDIPSFSKESFIEPLRQMGDSIVCVVNDSIVKIHIHTFTPEKVLEYARRFGELVTIKIENMSVQHSESDIQTEKPKEKVKYCIVTVAQGQGIIDYFYSIGANVVINGGQTSNPSVDAFLEAFNQFDAENIVVLPNNSNIILTANQAAELYDKCKVTVIPTKSVVEGYSALSMMNLWCESVDELVSDMSSGLGNVVSAYVTTATRNTVMNGVEVIKDNYIGIKNKEILLCSDERLSLTKQLIEQIVSEENSEVIIVFYGNKVDCSEADSLKDFLEQKYPLADVGFINGGQDVYDYIISLE